MDPVIAHAGSREKLLGPNPTPAATALYSPERNARPDQPPLWLLHAEDDSVVPVANSVRLREATRAVRSEEHTSELQSLMRISYAVFCLKKKNKKTANKRMKKSSSHYNPQEVTILT